MSEAELPRNGEADLQKGEVAPGDVGGSRDEILSGFRSYLVGLALAVFLTIVSFSLKGAPFIWGPEIPVALVVLAIAQMGVHLSFFLHITSGPDNTNNVLALAFGVLIVILVIGGSLWIMYNMNANMAAMPPMPSMAM